MYRVVAALALFVSLAWLVVDAAPPDRVRAERLAAHRNLGKSFYETPGAQARAVEEFRKALELEPDSARERLNLGLAYLANGQVAEGIAELERVQKQDPALPHTWFTLGVQYKRAGEPEKALEQFKKFVELAPREAAGHYNLGALHKLLGDTEAAIRAFETAARLEPSLAGPHFQLFNIFRQAGRMEEAKARLEAFQRAKQAQENAPMPEDLEWCFYSEILDPVEAAAPPLKPLELTFTGRRLAGPSATAGMIVVDRNGDGIPELISYGELAPGTRHAAAGDADNDGRADVAIVTGEGAALLMNREGRFERKPLPAPPGDYRVVVWLDYDHDYDQDLLLLGKNHCLLRNQGEAGFVDRSADFPFRDGEALSAVTLKVIPDTRAVDVAVSYAGGAGVLYRDRLAGRYEAQTLEALKRGARLLQAVDADGNGTIDLVTIGDLLVNRAGAFAAQPLSGPGPWIIADFDNRGIAELFTASRTRTALPRAARYEAADFNGDGKLDLAVEGADGSVHLFTNTTKTPYGALRVSLAGVKNSKLAFGSEVEVKAGRLYRKAVYPGYPLVIGVGALKTADVVRITWPNGLIQSEARQAVRAQAYKEAQRLSGSCPQVWTWNGREFTYVTDVLGVAPLGASDGEGTVFATDHLEHIQLPEMAPREGAYEIRLTEELAEVAYLDEFRLIAVDHPRETSIYLNERFQAPPFAELEIYSVGRRHYPEPGGRLVFRTVPEEPVMVLRGWTDWADGSEFRRRAQIPGAELALPVLETRREDGRWETAVADLGAPAGKPKAFAVRVPRAREYRIRTNMGVHWQEVFLGEIDRRPLRQTTLRASEARLRFRGFSQLIGVKPDRFRYAAPRPASMWNPTPGLYTRYGEVTSLVESADDRFVIMGSGDELVLRFDAAGFPPVPGGMRRSFVLAVDGWAKDQDPNTAFSQTVAPLPFHAMSGYPYGEQEMFPDTEAHRQWQREYNRRPAVRLLRPLAPRRGD